MLQQDGKGSSSTRIYDVVFYQAVGGAVASCLVRSSPDRAVQVRALAGVIALCSWARHFTLRVPLSTQVYKWVPAGRLMLRKPG